MPSSVRHSGLQGQASVTSRWPYFSESAVTGSPLSASTTEIRSGVVASTSSPRWAIRNSFWNSRYMVCPLWSSTP